MAELPTKSLLVEGTTDVYAVAQLMGHHIPWGKPPPVKIVACNGGEIFSKGRIPLELKTYSIVGVVIDADDDRVARWNQLRPLALAFFPQLPRDIPKEGLVESDTEGRRFGAWIMPDNDQAGMLETLLIGLIPEEQQSLWAHAQTATVAAKETHEATFIDAHMDRAKIHAWLAWQDPPGERLGEAIRDKIFDATSKRAQPFVSWFKKLFEL